MLQFISILYYIYITIIHSSILLYYNDIDTVSIYITTTTTNNNNNNDNTTATNSNNDHHSNTTIDINISKAPPISIAEVVQSHLPSRLLLMLC